MSIAEIGIEVNHRGIRRAKKNGNNYYLTDGKSGPTKEAKLKRIKKREALVEMLFALASNSCNHQDCMLR